MPAAARTAKPKAERRREQDGGEDDVEDEEEDEGAGRAAGEVDEQEHGGVIERHLVIGEALDRGGVGARVGGDAPGEDEEADVIGEDEGRGQGDKSGRELNADPAGHPDSGQDAGRDHQRRRMNHTVRLLSSPRMILFRRSNSSGRPVRPRPFGREVIMFSRASQGILDFGLRILDFKSKTLAPSRSNLLGRQSKIRNPKSKMFSAPRFNSPHPVILGPGCPRFSRAVFSY